MVVLNQDYSTWPKDSEERRRMAREIWGRDVISVYNAWLRAVQRMLFEGERLKRPSPEIREVEDWMAQLKPEQRQGALLFAKYAAHSVISWVLISLDNSRAGNWIAPVIPQYRLVLNIYDTDEGFLSGEPTETIDLQSENNLDFHDELWGWLDRYSEFGSIMDGLE